MMKIGLKMMLVLEALIMFSGGLFGPLYALFVEGVGGSIIDVGIASSIFLMSAAVLIYLIGKWADKIKH